VKNPKELSKADQIALWRVFNEAVTLAVSLGHSRDAHGLNALQRTHPREVLAAKKAVNHLLLSNHGIVVKQAKYYKGHCFSMAELIQIGNVGLAKALWYYNPDKEVKTGHSVAKFGSYAFFWIRAELIMAITKDRKIYVPNSQKNPAYKYSFVSQCLLSPSEMEANDDDRHTLDEILSNYSKEDIEALYSLVATHKEKKQYDKTHNISYKDALERGTVILEDIKKTYVQ
jgi:RNA polymerase sigma factor (sigma-70 family)